MTELRLQLVDKRENGNEMPVETLALKSDRRDYRLERELELEGKTWIEFSKIVYNSHTRDRSHRRLA